MLELVEKGKFETINSDALVYENRMAFDPDRKARVEKNNWCVGIYGVGDRLKWKKKRLKHVLSDIRHKGWEILAQVFFLPKRKRFPNPR